MGGSFYSTSLRAERAASMNYMSNSINDNFQQNKVRKIHESMDPTKAKLREARDSATHPNTVPIILAMDVTGSMGRIPQDLVQEGLPKMMGGIIQHGIPDPALLFLAVGDSQVDSYPLQVGQFESGDAELDMWLTRTYIESGGGGNAGESYHLAWYFAARHTDTDAFNKRGQKGFLFTIGDEPCLPSLSRSEVEKLMGDSLQAAISEKDLLKEAQEKWNVYHLHIMEGSAGTRSLGYWKELLGQNCIQVDHYKQVADVIRDIVVEHSPKQASAVPDASTPSSNEEIIL